MSKKLRISAIVLLLVTLSGFYVYKNVLYKDARNIGKEQPDFVVTAGSLVNEYVKNQPEADSKYLNKTIAVEGKVTEAEDSTLVLDNKVFCKMNDKTSSDFLNKTITIKGRCIGYDDLFEQVKLDQCTK